MAPKTTMKSTSRMTTSLFSRQNLRMPSSQEEPLSVDWRFMATVLLLSGPWR
jgi:hypothetical protein